MDKTIKKIISDCLFLIPDKQYLEVRYYWTFKKKPDFRNPKTYNEKIQWMKLYDRNPYYSRLVDKQEVKQIVKNIGGDVKVIPTLAIWERAEDIDISNLPEQFVLKCTHDSGSIKIYHSKKEFNFKIAKKHFNAALHRSQYKSGREWAYKNVKPRIIAEPFFSDDSGEGLKDYKFFCFDGKVKAMFIATDRGKVDCDVKFDFFDENFNHLPIRHGHENACVIPKKPALFDKMITNAEKISAGLRHVRVDLYEINNEIYFGEYTFYHHCGFVPFEPEEWDNKFGAWLRIGEVFALK